MAGRRIVVMGVSGCGKSTIGRSLAEALAVPYVEGDELHSPQNVAKMAAGIPLTDVDRQGWLQALARRLSDPRAQQQGVVVACSALKRAYRDQLREAAPDLLLIHLHGAPALLAQRLARREGHYMPASLLQSQLETLEPPQPDEEALEADAADAPLQIVADLLTRIRGHSAKELRA